MKIGVIGLSPPPPALKSDRATLMCAGCGSGFEALTRTGVYVKPMTARDGGAFYLPFCNGCAAVIADLELLVTTNLHSTSALRTAMRDAVALRQGYIERYDEQ